MEWEECPKCNALGRIDKEQAEGSVSIICSECGHHYHREASWLSFGEYTHMYL